MGTSLEIACIQTRPMPDFDSALEEMMPLAEDALGAGAELLATPEYCGGVRSEGHRLAPPAAREDSHPVLAALRDFARANRVWILVGSIAVESGSGRILNRGYVLDELGRIRSRYDKIHMFDVELSDSEIYRESATIEPGNAAVITDTPWARVGHTICYDLRFPLLFRDLAQAGAEIITVPSAFTRRTGEAHWHVLNRARAIENGCYVVSPCATGPVPGGGACYGHSLIVDPWGEVVADGGVTPGVLRASIDIGRVADARRRIRSLHHDRSYAVPRVESGLSAA